MTQASLASLVFLVLGVQAFGQLVHPGISHKRSDLDRMKRMVGAGAEPWASSFGVFRRHRRAQHDYVLDVFRCKCVVAYMPDPEIQSFHGGFSTDMVEL